MSNCENLRTNLGQGWLPLTLIPLLRFNSPSPQGPLDVFIVISVTNHSHHGGRPLPPYEANIWLLVPINQTRSCRLIRETRSLRQIWAIRPWRPDAAVYSALGADDRTMDCLLLDEGEGGAMALAIHITIIHGWRRRRHLPTGGQWRGEWLGR